MRWHTLSVFATALSKVSLFSQGQQSRGGQHWYSCSSFWRSHQRAPHPSTVSHYSVLGSRWNVKAIISVELHWCCPYHSSRHLAKGGNAKKTYSLNLIETSNEHSSRWGSGKYIYPGERVESSSLVCQSEPFKDRLKCTDDWGFR